MQTWAFANQKGGCGKTTTAVNLAAALSDRGHRVLLVDLDPQAHATLAVGQSAAGGPSIAQVFLDEAPVLSALRETSGGFALCPASLALAEFESLAGRRLHPERVLRRALAPVAGEFDWVLLDCPPRADGVLTANALRAATGVCLVVETGAFALQGAIRARQLLARLHEADEQQPEYRVVATMYDRRTRFARDVLIGLHSRFGSELFDTAVRESVQLREAAAYGQTVMELEPDGRAANDFRALAREFDAMTEDPSPAPVARLATPEPDLSPR